MGAKTKFSKILGVLISLAILFGVSKILETNLPLIHQILSKPCAAPITFNIGSFDSRFGISENDFMAAVNQAKSIWEKPINKSLFTYNTQGTELTINLIYDYRQQETQQLQKLGLQIQTSTSSYDQ